jgi:hypothetical protein
MGQVSRGLGTSWATTALSTLTTNTVHSVGGKCDFFADISGTAVRVLHVRTSQSVECGGK